MRCMTLAFACALATLTWPTLSRAATLPAPSPLPASSAVPASPVASPTVATAISPMPGATQQLVALTLAEAQRLARTTDPALNAKRAQLAAAQGTLTDSRAWLYNNPQLSYDRTRRDVPEPAGTDRRREWSGGVTQALEIAGQRGYRKASAEASLTALEAEIDQARLQARVDVTREFARVLVLQRRVELERDAASLFQTTASAVAKRKSAGEDTRLDANVATVEAERALNQRAQAEEGLVEARSELAQRLQLPSNQLPQAVGEPSTLADPVPYSLDQLLSDLARQPRLRALSAREDAARSRLDLERASRYPDVTVGVSAGREGSADARERLTTFSVSVPLPLFRRNAAGVGQANSDLTAAQLDRSVGMRAAESDVRALWSRLQSLQTRVQRLQGSVVPALNDNYQLSIKSQRAGEIGLLDLIVVNRQALDARRDLLDALLDYQTTRAALEAAAGWVPEGSNQ